MILSLKLAHFREKYIFLRKLKNFLSKICQKWAINSRFNLTGFVFWENMQSGIKPQKLSNSIQMKGKMA
jgi:hypothetical protein